MEEKIDGILSRLSPGEELAQRPPASRLDTQAAPNRYTGQGNATFDIRYKLPTFQFSHVRLDGFQDAISKGYVSFEQAEVSVRFFQGQANNFPFVVVDPTMGLDILRRKRPFLLLSIVALAAQ